jgi:hypothetical protein
LSDESTTLVDIVDPHCFVSAKNIYGAPQRRTTERAAAGAGTRLDSAPA